MVKFWLSKISKDIKLVLVFPNFNFVFWLYIDSKRKAFLSMVLLKKMVNFDVWHGPIVDFKKHK